MLRLVAPSQETVFRLLTDVPHPERSSALRQAQDELFGTQSKGRFFDSLFDYAQSPLRMLAQGELLMHHCAACSISAEPS